MLPYNFLVNHFGRGTAGQQAVVSAFSNPLSSKIRDAGSNFASSPAFSSALDYVKSRRSSIGGHSSEGSSSVASSPVDTSSQPETFDYLDAPWASAYQMSRETAYSEALNNTAYQRSVKDMQRAGLNPAVIFGAGNGYTAGVPAYVSSGASPSGSSRSGSSGSGRSKSSGKLFSSSAYSLLSALGGIVGAAATKTAGGYWIGTSLTQGAMSALSLLSNGVKKR